MNILARMWHKFERKVLDPVEAPSDQRLGMQKAYYAGVHATLHAFRMLGDSEMGDDVACAILVEMQDEVNQFFQEMN